MANALLTSKQMAMKTMEIRKEAFKGQPRWLVDLDKATVEKAFFSTENAPEYHAGKRDYFVRAQDELEAFMKARKMEEEGEGC